MNTATRAVRMLTVGCLCSMFSHAHAQAVRGVNGPESAKGTTVTLELTKLEVTDVSLALSYKIRNASDHEVWVCSEVSRGGTPFEIFLAQDKRTLVIRKRLDVPTFSIWRRPPDPGTYVRLSPGAVRPESLQIDLPATDRFMYASQTLEVFAETAKGLVLEIGYFDENLPALVRSIMAVGDQFSTEGWKLHAARLNPDMWQAYFRGLSACRDFSDYDIINKDSESKGYAYINYSHQALIEKVLRMEVSGVGIPYKGSIEVIPSAP